MSRLPPLAKTALSARQREIYESGGRVRPDIIAGPVRAQIIVPDLADKSTVLSEFLRNGTSLNARVVELAMLICAREWTSQYVWHVHEALALKAGVAKEVVDTIKTGGKPKIVPEDESVVYAYMRELFDTHNVSDGTYSRAIKCFGEAGLVELVSIIGYYTTLAMTVNTFQILPLSGETPLPPR